jgi:2-iminobutanoate/2-iminopropanoate deaminase
MACEKKKGKLLMKKLIHNVVAHAKIIARFNRHKPVITAFVLIGLLCLVPALSRAQQVVTMSTTDVAKLPFSPGLQLGDALYLSGHLGVDPAVGKAPADPEDEARQVLHSVDQTLKKAGMNMNDLVYVEIYCTDLKMYGAFNKAYRDFLKSPFPARDFVGVKDLLFGAHFEVMGIAVRDASLKKRQNSVPRD